MKTQTTATILVVDDDEANRYAKRRLLQQAGFDVIEAATGQDGLQLAATSRPALVLLDINLPDINGLEVCRHIKRDPALPSIFVLQISASLISPQDKARALEGGADGYLIEPVEPEEMVATVRSLLRLQRAEQALRESEERLRLAAEVTGFGTFDFDFDTGTGYCSPELKAIFGLPQDSEIQSPQQLVEHIHLADRARIQQQLETLQDLQEPAAFEDEYRIVRPDGNMRWILTKGKAFFANGERSRRKVRLTGIVLDITRRKLTEEYLKGLNEALERDVSERTVELQRRHRELDQFAYVASHDLKAPLRAINHLASWVIEDAGEILPPASQQHLMKLQGRIQRMERLLNDLVEYFRSDRKQRHWERVDTGRLVQHVIGLLNPPPGFTVSVPKSMPVIVTERAPLETVFLNLIGNALKHHPNPAAGEVVVDAQVQATTIDFTVTDNGAGIDPSFHTRIFEIFQTLQPEGVAKGSGIGLTLVKKFVESRGGAVHVTSAVGQGASFRFTWPKHPPPELLS